MPTHRGRVWLNYFNESQKGAFKWDSGTHIVHGNRTEALDAAKKGIPDGEVVLPRRVPLLEEFEEHLLSDAKKLIEDKETGAKSYRYIQTGTNHFSLAVTYDWIASERERRWSGSDTFIAVPDDDDDSARPIAWHQPRAQSLATSWNVLRHGCFERCAGRERAGHRIGGWSTRKLCRPEGIASAVQRRA